MAPKNPFETPDNSAEHALARLEDKENGRIQAVDKAFLELDREQKEKKVSYFELVPEEYKAVVQDLSEKGFVRYQKKFPDGFDHFRNEMSKNWLAKSKAFGSLAEAAGFSKADRPFRETDRAKANKLAFAMLSRSASYILVGPGAFDRHGSGASSRYVRIPLRKASKISEDVQHGVFLANVPRIGEGVEIEGRLESSPLISIYVSGNFSEDSEKSGETIRILSESVSGSFTDIDYRTFREDTMGSWRRGPKK